VLGCCERYSTNIDSVITYRFDIKNIDRIANTASDDVCNRVAMLNELNQCRDGMLCLSDDSFSRNDVEQLNFFFMHQLMTFLHYFSFFSPSELHLECELILCLHVSSVRNN